MQQVDIDLFYEAFARSNPQLFILIEKRAGEVSVTTVYKPVATVVNLVWFTVNQMNQIARC